MEETRKYFENLIQVKGVKQKEIAKLLNVSPVTIHKFVDGVSELGFDKIHKAVEVICDKEDTLLTKACMEFSKAGNIKHALEYMSTKGQTTSFYHILNKWSYSDKDKEWFEVYSLVYKFQSRESSYDDIVEEIYDLLATVNNKYLRVLLRIVEGYVYYMEKEYKSLKRVTKLTGNLLKDLDDNYFKRSLQLRLCELKCRNLLHYYNNPTESRKYAITCINLNLGGQFVADAYTMLGLSFIFEDYNQAMQSFNKAAELYSVVGRDDLHKMIINKNIPMTETFWNVGLDNIPQNIDESEKAHRLAKRNERGDADEALSILANLDETPFRLYYRGLASGDANDFWKSLGAFKNADENFFLNLPSEELGKNEVFSEAVQAII